MSRLSMNEMTTFRWSFEEDVENYRRAGYQAIGVWRQKLSDFGEEKGIELLAESGLHVSNLLWAGGFTGSDGRSYRESLEDAAEAIELAGAMKADCLVVYSGARGGHTLSHARRLLRDALRELAPQAAAAGVLLAVEPMHENCAAEWTFLTQLDQTLELLNQVESPQVRLAFDTYHLGHGPAACEAAARCADRIAVVHLGDGQLPPGQEQNRCCLGKGNLGLREIVQALEAGGYRGYYDVELFGEDIEASDYHELLKLSCTEFSRLLAR
ncbi:MAG: sugar phosphate isomerase/epimerase [Pirellulales bacterium]|nr:sugar phosphate isomerase/epimerase [Pirellulales bacterium]